jgi:hypothetical protein
MSAAVSDEPTNEQVLDAIDVLKRAGLNITVSPDVDKEQNSTGALTNDEPAIRPANTSGAKQAINPAEYINPEYQTINMMLGNGNNNNDPMMNMLPYMLQQNSEGKNIDPQVMQTLMMNSMMNGINGLNSTENK